MSKPLLVISITVVAIAVISAVWLVVTPAERNVPTPTVTAREGYRQAWARPAGPSMYERVGPDAIRCVVDQFYHRVLADPRLASYFSRLGHHDLAQLRQHQVDLVAQVLGGPIHYDLRQLGAAHQGLRIDTDAYWRVVGHLGATLAGLRVPRDVSLHLISAVYDLQEHIVEARTTAGRTV